MGGRPDFGRTGRLIGGARQRVVGQRTRQQLAGGRVVDAGLEERLAFEGPHAVIEGAHSRQDGSARVRHLFGPPHQAHLSANLEQRLVHAAQVAGTVIEQCDHKAHDRVVWTKWQTGLRRVARPRCASIPTSVCGFKIRYPKSEISE
jgi:hypothetical protein